MSASNSPCTSTQLTTLVAKCSTSSKALEGSDGPALSFRLLAECPKTGARASTLHLPHATVPLPVFMPVGTQGTMKSLTAEQLAGLDCQLCLANTYHLGHRPGPELLKDAGGLHRFMHWPRGLVTDSGGFQMVSLLKLACISEEGVQFCSPHDGSQLLLTPEHSIELQNTIGADIIMQLDDVVDSSEPSRDRVAEAARRSVRWLDRCMAVHRRPHEQSLFGIVQGGLHEDLRRECAAAMVARQLPGYAIGGLSGGEEKAIFWRIVALCTSLLPRNKPRYVMGVGLPLDLVVCIALGADMFDCVLPTRTARFGSALVDEPGGLLHLRQVSCRCGLCFFFVIHNYLLQVKRFEKDMRVIDDTCNCPTCAGGYSRSYLTSLTQYEAVRSTLLTQHNIAYQLRLMQRAREAILTKTFPDFVQQFMTCQFRSKEEYPQWAVEAFLSIGLSLK